MKDYIFYKLPNGKYWNQWDENNDQCDFQIIQDMEKVLNFSTQLDTKVVVPNKNDDTKNRVFRVGDLIVMRVHPWQVSAFNSYYDEQIEDGLGDLKIKGEYWQAYLDGKLGLSDPWL